MGNTSKAAQAIGMAPPRKAGAGAPAGAEMRRRLAWLALVFAIALRHPSGFAQTAINLVGAGSSVPVPLYAKWKQEYNKRSPGIQMEYVAMGTTEGMKQAEHGISDFGAGEVPLTEQEHKDAHMIELPATQIGIVPIYNLPGPSQELKFSGELLAGIFLGQIKTWNAPQIARLNPNLSLPNLPIKVVYRPGGKGTNYVFTDFLSKTSPSFRAQIGRSPSPKWPVGEPAERSSDMVNKVKSESGSIGYVELQYALEDKIPYGLVLNPAGKFVKATPDTITAACAALEAPLWDKFAPSLTNAPGANSFPITSFTWLYVRTTSTEARRAAALVDMLNWMFSNGQQLVAQVGYAELPKPLLVKVQAKVKSLYH